MKAPGPGGGLPSHTAAARAPHTHLHTVRGAGAGPPGPPTVLPGEGLGTGRSHHQANGRREQRACRFPLARLACRSHFLIPALDRNLPPTTTTTPAPRHWRRETFLIREKKTTSPGAFFFFFSPESSVPAEHGSGEWSFLSWFTKETALLWQIAVSLSVCLSLPFFLSFLSPLSSLFSTFLQRS